jgi:beta-glucanase (GH16 family)
MLNIPGNSIFVVILLFIVTGALAEPPADREWQRIDQFSDEFDGNSLDASKWYDYNPNWPGGRHPGYFNSANVRVEDGYLNLYTTNNNDGTYSTATTRSLEPIRYGYFEASIKTHKSASTTAFWFYNDNPPEDNPDYPARWTEIDVVECGGNSPNPIPQDSLTWHTVHYFNPHWMDEQKNKANFVTYEDYHTYGCLWTEDTIAFYVDNEFVYGRWNEGWKFPLHMLFDCEIFVLPGDNMDFGIPSDEDLPSYMSVDWVRSWEDQGPVSTIKQAAGLAQSAFSVKGNGMNTAVYDLHGRRIPSGMVSGRKSTYGTLLIKTDKGLEKLLRLP